jgi:hypothetical protein
MTKIAILLASTLTVALFPQIAMGKDPSMAEDVQAMFGPVCGARPVSLAGTLTEQCRDKRRTLGPFWPRS